MSNRPDDTTLEVTRIRHLDAALTPPGDKSISHRGVILGGLAEGETKLTHFLPGEDCLSTLRAMQALGVHMEMPDRTTVIVRGTAGKLRAAAEPIDCGNAGTGMRLLAGLLAGQPFASRLFGDKSLHARPMQRVIDPLTKMGAKITAEGTNGRPPLAIAPAELTGIEYHSPVASAQLKSCLLLAGLFAKGTTAVTEPAQSRDHTERLFKHFGAPCQVEGRTVSLRGGRKLIAKDLHVPGDFSSAAFWIVAAAALPGAQLELTNVGLNPTRTAALSVLLRMGAHVQENVESCDAEPWGKMRVYGRRLRGTTIGGSEIPNLIDELPILAVAAALADGTTEIRDARELRVKETDRIAALAKNLAAFGVAVQEREDGMVIHGGGPLYGADVESFGDHRIAMAFAILGLFAKGTTRVHNIACIETSYPGFFDDLRKVAGRAVRRRRMDIPAELPVARIPAPKPEKEERAKPLADAAPSADKPKADTAKKDEPAKKDGKPQASTAPKPGETKPADAKAAAPAKPGDTKPATTKPADAKPPVTVPPAKAGDAKASATKPTDPKPAEAKPPLTSPPPSPEKK